jgi:hypothetical protein
MRQSINVMFEQKIPLPHRHRKRSAQHGGISF